ncbi:hypothetical protein PV05_03461 [Exophiala xenobiotica]|uniref:Uncharacterized protein n=1 Tax=Exophiala xenobiotica TaxID=348802 RepID=A0A0D2ETE8_9EURO|nr:uncharacterized protein PV05_03461 [Exophiala xenobiotica]KIW58973.1 hypothetical protein PV05_03461 [Exophiala xenobiotica]
MPSQGTPRRPENWLPEHDIFVRRQARNGEDVTSILILFETEYPNVKVSKEWIKERTNGSSYTR